MPAAIEGAEELEVRAMQTVHVPKHNLGIDVGRRLVARGQYEGETGLSDLLSG